jgi:hypothetical protein
MGEGASDTDRSGQKHAQDIASDLDGVAATVRVLTLPDLPPKGDIVNWLDAGGTRAQLEESVAATAPRSDGRRVRATEDDEEPESSSAHAGAEEEPRGDVRHFAAWWRWQKRVYASALSSTQKIIAIAARAEVDGPDVAYRPAPHDQEPKKVYLPRIAERCGMNVSTISEALRNVLDPVGLFRYTSRVETVERALAGDGGRPITELVTRSYLAPGALLATPEVITQAPRPDGGKRAGAGRPRKCLSCGSEDIEVIERTIREVRCHTCGSVETAQVGPDRPLPVEEKCADDDRS